MGQKVHPKSLRIGYIYDWDSKWFSKKNMPNYIEQDYKIRSFINKKYRVAGISSVIIERAGKHVRLNINTARPGIVIGKKGTDVELLKTMVEKLTKQETFVNINEVKNLELDPQLIATTLALQIEKKVSYKMLNKYEKTSPMDALISTSVSPSRDSPRRSLLMTAVCFPRKYPTYDAAGYTRREVPPMISRSAARIALTAPSTASSGSCSP